MKSAAVFLGVIAALFPAIVYGAAPQWVEVRSPHFTLISDASEKDARHVLDQLERMRWVFQKLYSRADVDPPQPILVLAARNKKTLQSVEPAAYLAKGQLNLAGYFLRTQDQNYILLRLDTEGDEHPFATVYHEYTHLQFSGAGEWLPLWLNEGTAEFFQNTTIRDKDVLLGQPDNNDILYLRQQRLIPLPVLFKVDASSPYYHEEQKGSVFYAESWALTHYLHVTDKEKGTHQLFDYITLVSQHEDPAIAAEKAFGNLKQLQSSLEAYIHRGEYKQFVMNSAAAPIDQSSYKARALALVEADAARADILAKVQREKDARDLIDSILKTDPENAAVRETLGAMEFAAGNIEGARKWYAEAVKLNPKSAVASYNFASLSLQSGHGDDERIEPSLREAIAANPSYAPAYEVLASYLGMHREKLDEALTLIRTAVKLDPGNYSFRINGANLLASMGKYDDAVATLGAAVKLARNPEQVAMAQREMDELRQVQKRQAEYESERREAPSRPAGDSGLVDVIPAAEEIPKHPAEANGPKHTVFGVIQKVTCSYPTMLELQVEAGGRTYAVYTNDFHKIDLDLVGFMPTGDWNLCTNIEGMKARVRYAESSDKSVDGKVLGIELHK